MAFILKPSYDVAMGNGVSGFTTWYHYYPDLRDLRRDERRGRGSPPGGWTMQPD